MPGTMNHTLLTLCCLSLALLAGSSNAADIGQHLAALGNDDSALDRYVAEPWSDLNPEQLKLRSVAALVLDRSGNVVYAKHSDEARPIASITKLMTAMVVLDRALPLDEMITITRDDRDLIRLTGSRLDYGARLSRGDLLRLALMASENRAASALGRTYPGGKAAFIEAMNRKARTLGMSNSRFADPAGLDAANVASARDLAIMVRAARNYALIRAATTTQHLAVRPFKGRGELHYNNTNRLLKNQSWEIGLSKTGYINEAGRCLVMQTEIAERPVVIVLLNSFGKLTPFGDSNRIRKWIESSIGG